MPIERDKNLRDSVIAEMNSANGIEVYPNLITIGHGYHPETGADGITIGSYDRDRTQHLITLVLPLELAREARDLLTEQIARVDKLNSTGVNGD